MTCTWVILKMGSKKVKEHSTPLRPMKSIKETGKAIYLMAKAFIQRVKANIKGHCLTD